MTTEDKSLREMYKDCIDEIFEYCMERRYDPFACEILRITDKHFDRILGYGKRTDEVH